MAGIQPFLCVHLTIFWRFQVGPGAEATINLYVQVQASSIAEVIDKCSRQRVASASERLDSKKFLDDIPGTGTKRSSHLSQ